MAKAKRAAPKSDGKVKIVCIVDRLPLDSGEVIIRDQTAEVSPDDAKSLETQGRAKRA